MKKMCEKKDNTDIFTWKEWLLFLPLFIIYIVLGSYVLFIANPLLAYCYVIYIILFFHIGFSIFSVLNARIMDNDAPIFMVVYLSRDYSKKEKEIVHFLRRYIRLLPWSYCLYFRYYLY